MRFRSIVVFLSPVFLGDGFACLFLVSCWFFNGTAHICASPSCWILHLVARAARQEHGPAMPVQSCVQCLCRPTVQLLLPACRKRIDRNPPTHRTGFYSVVVFGKVDANASAPSGPSGPHRRRTCGLVWLPPWDDSPSIVLRLRRVHLLVADDHPSRLEDQTRTPCVCCTLCCMRRPTFFEQHSRRRHGILGRCRNCCTDRINLEYPLRRAECFVRWTEEEVSKQRTVHMTNFEEGLGK